MSEAGKEKNIIMNSKDEKVKADRPSLHEEVRDGQHIKTDMDTPGDDYDEYDDDFEEKNKCPDCGRGDYDDGHCPMCCGSGMYAPGSEECDFCEHSDECAEHAASL